MAAGWALGTVGFVPNQVQDAVTQLVIRMLITLVPAGCVLTGAILLTRFRLTDDGHARIRAQLARRSSEAP